MGALELAAWLREWKSSLDMVLRVDGVESERDSRLLAAARLIERFAAVEQRVMNLPCDPSATAPEHHAGFKNGHKQARHAAAELIAQVLSDE